VPPAGEGRHRVFVIGMSADSGKALGGLDHLRQSIRTILSTRKGSRVMRPTFGSELHKFVDMPLVQTTIMQIYASAATSIAEWEPRVNLQSISAYPREGTGKLALVLRCEVKATGEEFRVVHG
jgi:phage baseplate assembly protein W